jgi:uncharacterized protein (TIGR03437 family)
MSAGIVTRGIVTDAGGNLIYSGNPAHTGQALIMWLTGLGAAAKNAATGYTESILRPEIWLLNLIYALRNESGERQHFNKTIW